MMIYYVQDQSLWIPATGEHGWESLLCFCPVCGLPICIWSAPATTEGWIWSTFGLIQQGSSYVLMMFEMCGSFNIWNESAHALCLCSQCKRNCFTPLVLPCLVLHTVYRQKVPSPSQPCLEVRAIGSGPFCLHSTWSASELQFFPHPAWSPMCSCFLCVFWNPEEGRRPTLIHTNYIHTLTHVCIGSDQTFRWTCGCGEQCLHFHPLYTF